MRLWPGVDLPTGVYSGGAQINIDSATMKLPFSGIGQCTVRQKAFMIRIWRRTNRTVNTHILIQSFQSYTANFCILVQPWERKIKKTTEQDRQYKHSLGICQSYTDIVHLQCGSHERKAIILKVNQVCTRLCNNIRKKNKTTPKGISLQGAQVAPLARQPAPSSGNKMNEWTMKWREKVKTGAGT